jgi:hypothetical protein
MQAKHIRSTLKTGLRTMGTNVYTDPVTMEEYRAYSELFNRIEAGHSITPQDMATIKYPAYKKILLVLLMQRQINRSCAGSYQA